MARNKYPGNCLRCGAYIKQGVGFFELNSKRANEHLHHGKRSKWSLRCMDCVREGHTKLQKEIRK